MPHPREEEEEAPGERLRLEAQLSRLVADLSRLKLQKKKQGSEIDQYQEELEQWKKQEETRTQESNEQLEIALQEWHEREQEHARVQAKWKKRVKPGGKRQQRDTPRQVTSKHSTKEAKCTSITTKSRSSRGKLDQRGKSGTKIYESLRRKQSSRDGRRRPRSNKKESLSRSQSTKQYISEPSLSTYLQSSSRKPKRGTGRRQVSRSSILSTQSSRASSTATTSSFSKFLMGLQAESSVPSPHNDRLLRLNTSYLRKKPNSKRHVSSSSSKKKKRPRRGSLGLIMERLEEETTCSSSDGNTGTN